MYIYLQRVGGLIKEPHGKDLAVSLIVQVPTRLLYTNGRSRS